MKVITGPHHAR